MCRPSHEKINIVDSASIHYADVYLNLVYRNARLKVDVLSNILVYSVRVSRVSRINMKLKLFFYRRSEIITIPSKGFSINVYGPI